MTMKISQSVPFIGGLPYLHCRDIEVVMLRQQRDNLSVSIQRCDIVWMSQLCCGDVATLFRFSKWSHLMSRH